MNTTITHCTAARSVPNASRIAGNPTFTAKSSDASTIPSADANGQRNGTPGYANGRGWR